MINTWPRFKEMEDQ